MTRWSPERPPGFINAVRSATGSEARLQQAFLVFIAELGIVDDTASDIENRFTSLVQRQCSDRYVEPHASRRRSVADHSTVDVARLLFECAEDPHRLDLRRAGD